MLSNSPLAPDRGFSNLVKLCSIFSKVSFNSSVDLAVLFPALSIFSVKFSKPFLVFLATCQLI
jgi:hypothetical protein